MKEGIASATLFPIGKFKGRGEWTDRKGGRGEYTTAFQIIEEADNAKTQITRREFLNDDGSLLYVENSIVTVKILENHFVEITITSGESISVGQGYCFHTFLHYDLDVAEDNHLENTYFFSSGKVALLGSATNKGNYTVWTEILYPVE